MNCRDLLVIVIIFFFDRLTQFEFTNLLESFTNDYMNIIVLIVIFCYDEVLSRIILKRLIIFKFTKYVELVFLFLNNPHRYFLKFILIDADRSHLDNKLGVFILCDYFVYIDIQIFCEGYTFIRELYLANDRLLILNLS